MIKRIEFVCTANNGKSPIALAVARDHVKKNREYALSSTGVMVDVITKSEGAQLARYLKQFCNGAYERGIISIDELENLETDHGGLLERFLINERRNRDRYLEELGLEFLDYPTQTHAVDSNRIIACIGDLNLKRVRAIYNDSEYSPIIINLMGKDYPEVSNQWVLSYGEFRNIAEDVKGATIRLLESELVTK